MAIDVVDDDVFIPRNFYYSFRDIPLRLFNFSILPRESEKAEKQTFISFLPENGFFRMFHLVSRTFSVNSLLLLLL